MYPKEEPSKRRLLYRGCFPENVLPDEEKTFMKLVYLICGLVLACW